MEIVLRRAGQARCVAFRGNVRDSTVDVKQEPLQIGEGHGQGQPYAFDKATFRYSVMYCDVIVGGLVSAETMYNPSTPSLSAACDDRVD